MTCRNPQAVYACLNLAGADCPDAIRMRSILVASDIEQALHSLALCRCPGGQAGAARC